jgi:AbrB family looped-hinge helix DNA binding protein
MKYVIKPLVPDDVYTDRAEFILIPKEIRERLGVHPGEEVGFEEKENLVIITKAVSKSPFDKWVGKLKHLKGQQSDDLVREARGNDNGC